MTLFLQAVEENGDLYIKIHGYAHNRPYKVGNTQEVMKKFTQQVKPTKEQMDKYQLANSPFCKSIPKTYSLGWIITKWLFEEKRFTTQAFIKKLRKSDHTILKKLFKAK